MADLIKVSVSLRNVDRPIRRTWRVRLAGISVAAATIASPLFLATAHTDPAVVFVSIIMLMIVMAVAVPYGMARLSLPASARKFLRETRSEHDELVRRTEAHNRAWCLAERACTSGEYYPNPMSRRVEQEYSSSFVRLDDEVRAYAERYRSAVAVDIARVNDGVRRRLLRESVSERSQDLRELEARLAELGQDAQPDAYAQVAELRAALERDRQSLLQPLALPAAQVVSR